MGESRYGRPVDLRPKRQAFAMVYASEIPAWICHGLDVALHLEIVRLSGLRQAKHREGWVAFTAGALRAIGLNNRYTRRSVVQRAIAQGWLEVRSYKGAGHKLEYRLRPGWVRDAAEVIDLATRRKRGAA